MNPQVPRQPAVAKPTWRLELALQRELDGPDIAAEPVTDADLADHRGEVWMAGCLRRGHVDCPLEALRFELEPVGDRGGRRGATGFLLRATPPGGKPTECRFTRYSLQHVAEQAAGRLVEAGVLKAGDPYFYRIIPRRTEDAPARPGVHAGVRLTPRTSAVGLHVLRVPLARLLARAEAGANGAGNGDGAYPVFYTRKARAKAEETSRRGAASAPAVETGGMLLGALCSCPETGELFTVLTDIVAFGGVREQRYALATSARTWREAEVALRAASMRAGTRWHVPVGQCHGHNFLPGEIGPSTSSSVFVSTDDRRWHGAVFPGQPYQLCHIFGLDRRGGRVDRLFGLSDGRLLPRGYRVVQDFDLRPYLDDVIPCPRPSQT